MTDLSAVHKYFHYTVTDLPPAVHEYFMKRQRYAISVQEECAQSSVDAMYSEMAEAYKALNSTERAHVEHPDCPKFSNTWKMSSVAPTQ